MVFLDTNIWIELCALRTPVQEHEKAQALAASKLLNELLKSNSDIVTNKNQILELVFVIEKTKLKAYNRSLKQEGEKKINSVKEYRKTQDFLNSIDLIKSAVNDVLHLANDTGYIDFQVDSIVEASFDIDVTDALFYKYCTDTGILFYTFDKEIKEYDDNHNGNTVILVN